MKKILLMLLVLTGTVCTASAATLYIDKSNLSWWQNARIYSYNSSNERKYSWQYTTDDTLDGSTISRFGRNWMVFNVDESYNNIVIQDYADNPQSGWNPRNKTKDIENITSDTYVILLNKWDNSDNGAGVCYVERYEAPAFRSNVLGNMSDGYSSNMEAVDNNTLTYTFLSLIIFCTINPINLVK